MIDPIKILDIELSRPLPNIDGLEGYIYIKGLVRLHGVPIGYIQAPITNGCCSATTLSQLILEKHSYKIIQTLLEQGLAAPSKPEKLNLKDLLDMPPPDYQGDFPMVTVAVCTRDRTSDLALCLDALNKLDYPHLDILIVDNAPTSETTKELVQTKYPHVRYVCEPRPGLDWARNRAILEAKGEIIAYTDDDVIVDSGWVKALAQLFSENPEVMAVTGLVVPYEQETEAQVLFEKYGGFGRGFERKWYRAYPGSKLPWQWLGTGQFGTGANMAYRRCVFEKIGYFDPALDVGTVTNGGGDLEMFFRVLQEGHTLVYEPRAIIRHRHRREYEKLKTQLKNNGSLYSYFICGAMAYPQARLSFLWLGIFWLLYWNIRRLLISWLHPISFPRDLILAELQGGFIGLTRYQKARKNALEIAQKFGATTPDFKGSNQKILPIPRKTAVRTLDLAQSLQPLTDITDYSDVRVFVKWNNYILGDVDIPNIYQSVSVSRLIQVIAAKFPLQLLYPNSKLKSDFLWAKANATLLEKYHHQEEETTLETSPRLPANVSVSVLVGTFDRPDDLRNCLNCLVAQQTQRKVEIIVVDNHPDSGLTPPVVAQFRGVKLVSEPRQGVAYARNAGIVASTGEIIVTTDDDVTIPPDWLENLIAPFAKTHVMAVSGNILPVELETISQRFFERYGGLGRGYDVFEVNGEWFDGFRYEAVPVWALGGTANAAFRANLFSDPKVGLMDEALGPGMPSGVGEDSYLFYKILKAGYTLAYEPTAYLWHKHRRDMSALRRQIYNYSKGHISHHLTTIIKDGDWRGLLQILTRLPLYHVWRIYNWLRGRSNYPLSLVLLEIRGNLAGPWSLWRSHQRVKQQGHSSPYIPFAERSSTNSLAEQVTV